MDFRTNFEKYPKGLHFTVKDFKILKYRDVVKPEEIL